MRKFLSRVMALVMVFSMATAMQAQEKARPINSANLPAPKSEKALRLPTTKAQALKFSLKSKDNVARANKRVNVQRPAMAKAPSAGSENLTASLIYTKGGQDYGMYKFSTAAPCTYEAIATGEDYMVNYGGCVAGDGYYYMNYLDIFLGMVFANVTYVYDYKTWELVKMVDHGEGEDLSNAALSMTYDPNDDVIYGCFYDETGEYFNLATFNTETCTSTPIAPLEIVLYGMAVGKDGVLYGFTANSQVVSINKQTAELTVITTSDDIDNEYLTGAATDPISGLIYYAPNTDDYSRLVTFDPATKAIATVYELPDEMEIAGLAFEPIFAEAGAPGAGTFDKVNFEGTSLTGQIVFTAPATTFDGSKGSGSLRYELRANGEVVASNKNVNWGRSYSTYVTVPENGMYTLQLVFINEVGEGVKVSTKLYIGADSPKASESVTASYASGKMTINWDAVDAGAHNGTIGAITYNVYTLDGTELAEGLTTTSYEFALTEPKDINSYQFYVVAVSDGMESEPAYSNEVILGAVKAPYSSALVTESDLLYWTIINANGGNTWTPTGTETGGTSIIYESDNDKDDWLISPPIQVEKGKKYTVSIQYKGGSVRYPEQLEIWTGTNNTVAGMTNKVFDEELTSGTAEWNDYSFEYSATADGQVCVGIHSTSDVDMLTTYVKNFSFSGGIYGTEPAAASDLNVVVATDGTPKATITYAAPTTNINGDALPAANKLTRIETYVNGEIVSVDNSPVQGAVTSFEYTAATSGNYEFKVIAYNNIGAGAPAIKNAYLGINVPGPVTNAKFVEISDGIINITWDAPAADVDGNYINPALITYSLIDLMTEEVVEEGITDTKIENFQAAKAGEQEFVQFAVIPETAMGQGDAAYTNFGPVGTPDQTPYFLDGVDVAKYPLGIMQTANAQLLAFPDDYFEDVASRNSDGGFFGIFARNIGQYAVLYTGKIGVTQPGSFLTFYQYGFGAADENTLDVTITCDDEEEVFNFVQNMDNEWVKESIDLAKYVGKTITVSFKGTIQSHTLILFDDVLIGVPVAYDLVAKNITAPAVITTEKDFNIGYTVFNDGAKASGAYKVSLYADGNLVETANCESIEPGETATGTFSREAYNLFEAGTYKFYYVVEFEDDAEVSNNTSKTVTVRVVNSEFPTIELAGSIEDNKVTLEWETPLIDISQMDVFESFESAEYPVFTTESFSGWTIVNYNTSATYGFGGVEFPGSGTSFGWILFDTQQATTSDGSPSSIKAYEGSCMMGAFAHQSGANDAWLISPAIDAAGQTISFMARAQDASYNEETFEVYYTTGSMDTADFIKIDEGEVNDTEEWEEFSYELPAGATHFAIRSTAYDQFVLWIDGVNFRYSSPFVDLELTGYDIYRDQVKIGTAGVVDTQYVDTLAAEGEYTYHVVAVYNNGNSAPSNEYKVEWTGVADAVAACKVAVENKTIVVTGADDVVIAAADGKVVASAKGENVVKTTVSTGVYVVKAGNKVTKVIVK